MFTGFQETFTGCNVTFTGEKAYLYVTFTGWCDIYRRKVNSEICYLFVDG